MRLGLALVGVIVFAAPAFAAAPTPAQKTEFYQVCMGIASDDTLCSCKADAAMSLIDERFMGVVIASMKGGSPAEGDYAAYNTYVAKSNQVCKPNY
ncbi:hypothetical protein GCM10007913_34670 [Devosia yakushimensis]|uniref:Rap1a immunity protein domain-containing protein n=1 Tax=Devosia yakushimensis TaxID=470028 RepID=A0ABQ5UHG1_9HYPH|nr:hypothetical protein [Devosia yakushimensis]GLQ11535.1 hypothetical protein GCM10007913_34670 [Devosia yakushimensis]